MWKKICRTLVTLTAMTFVLFTKQTQAQSVVPIRGDTIRVYKQGDTALLKVDSLALITGQALVGRNAYSTSWQASTSLGLLDTIRALRLNKPYTRRRIVTPVNGMIIYEDSTDQFLRYQAGAWESTTSNLSYNSGTHAIDISGGGTSAVIPFATGSVNGLVSTTSQTFAGNKLFTSTLDWRNTAVADPLLSLTGTTNGTNWYGTVQFAEDLTAFAGNLRVRLSGLSANRTWVLPDVNAIDTLATLSDVRAGSGGTPTLTATQIAFGDGSNLMTSSSRFTWDDANKTLILGNALHEPKLTFNSPPSGQSYIQMKQNSLDNWIITNNYDGPSGNSRLKFSGFNLAGSFQGIRLALSASDGKVSMDGYGSSSAFNLATDTTNYKIAVFNSTGDIHRMFWSGVGGGTGSQTLQQVFNTEVGGSVLTKSDTISMGTNSLYIHGTSGFVNNQTAYRIQPSYTSNWIAALDYSGNGTSAYGTLSFREFSTGGGDIVTLKPPTNITTSYTLNLPQGNDGDTLTTENRVRTGAIVMENKRWIPRQDSTASSATPTINSDNIDIYKLTALAANITSMTTNLSGTPRHGEIMEIQITGTATRTIAWGSAFVSTSVALPVTTDGTNTLTVILQYYTNSSYGNFKWHCVNYY